MKGQISLFRPFLVAHWHRGARRLMDIILHVGSHRTSSTSFQHYLRGNRTPLLADDTVVWDPQMLRNGVFSGLFAKPRLVNGRELQRRAAGRVRIHTEQVRRAGAARLIVSEENMIGAPRNCLHTKSLYPAIGERIARLSAAFDGQVTRVVMMIRAQDLWWSSVVAYGVGRGHPVPDAVRCAEVAANPRRWRDVITDMACAIPGAEIKVLPFEQFAGRADLVMSQATGRPAPRTHAQAWLNRSPDVAALRSKLVEQGGDAATLPDHLQAAEGRWSPFTPAQAAALREAYADDIMWLTAGAGGLATLTEDHTRDKTGFNLSAGAITKGHSHDQQTDLRRQGFMA